MNNKIKNITLTDEEQKWLLNHGYKKLSVHFIAHPPSDMPNSLKEKVKRAEKEFNAICNEQFQSFDFSPLTEAINNLGKMFSGAFKNFDYKKTIQHMTEEVLYANQNIVKEFNDKGYFPPIFYCDENNVLKLKEFNLENEELIEFYLDQIKLWKKPYYPVCVTALIDEIIDGYKNKRIYTITIALFTLLEYRLKISKLKKQEKEKKEKPSIYGNYKYNLKEKIFDDKSELWKFVNQKIFCDTNYAKVLTRHIVHGEKLELIDYESMMSLIFFYDYIDTFLNIDENLAKELPKK